MSIHQLLDMYIQLWYTSYMVKQTHPPAPAASKGNEMTLTKIQEQIENTIRKECHQQVEITFFSANGLSMIGSPNAVRIAHTQLMELVDSLTIDEQVTYEEDDEEVIFYTF